MQFIRAYAFVEVRRNSRLEHSSINSYIVNLRIAQLFESHLHMFVLERKKINSNISNINIILSFIVGHASNFKIN